MQERNHGKIQVTPSLEVIAGPMFSGKTGELIERLVRHEIGKKRIQAFKSEIDIRYSRNEIVSHSGAKFPAYPVANDKPELILKLVKPETQVVGIEEVQFFDPQIVNVCEELTAKGKIVIVSGLPSDFRGEPFGSMPILMAKADKIDKIHAVCMTCGDHADFTQRIVNGKPADYSEPIVLVGASESYEARCRQHHEVPGRPNKK